MLKAAICHRHTHLTPFRDTGRERSPAILHPRLLTRKQAPFTSAIACRASKSDSSAAVPEDGPSSPQPNPTPLQAAWDRTRGLGWLKFAVIWTAFVALAMVMPHVLQRLSGMEEHGKNRNPHTHPKENLKNPKSSVQHQNKEDSPCNGTSKEPMQRAGDQANGQQEAPQPAFDGAKNVLLLNMEFLLDRMARFNLMTKILFVLAAGTPLVFAFSVAHHMLTGTAWDASFQKFYLLIFRMPGMSVTSDKTVSGSLLVNLAYYIGLFTFAIFLGVVTEEVKNTFKSIKGGMLPVRETGHTVILNWNKYTPLVLQAIATAKALDPSNTFYQRPVSVLSERPKAEMDAAVKNLGLNIHVRTGNPNLGKDLQKVAAGKATTVLVLQPENKQDPGDVAAGFNARAKVAATAMTVSSLFSSGNAGQRLILHESRGEKEHIGSFLDSVRSTCKDLIDSKKGTLQVALLGRNDMAQRFLALSAIQPGVSKIYSEILCPGGASLHTMQLPELLDGATYVQIRRSFQDAVICGYIRGGVVNLLPSDTDVLKAEDCTLVFLSHTSKAPTCSEAHRDIFEACTFCSKEKPSKGTPRKVIVVAVSAIPVVEMTNDFSQFAVPGSVVTFILPAACQKAAQAVSLPQGHCKFNLHFVQDNNPASTKALADTGIKDADSVVIAGIASSGIPIDEVDHCTMAILLQIQEAVRASGRTSAPHVVARIRNKATAAAISDFFTSYKKAMPPGHTSSVIERPELLQIEQLIGAVLAQSASSRFYLPIMEHLLNSANGAEIYTRDPLAYGLRTGVPIPFADITEHARLFNETAIGFATEDGKTVLALEPTAMVTLQPGHRIVSLAADHVLSRSKRA